VAVSFLVHALDVGLDLVVMIVFLVHYQWGFFIITASLIFWAWLIGSLYVSFGAGSPGAGDIDDGGLADRIPQCMLGFVQYQVFAEAYSVLFKNGDSDFFFTLRLMEAVTESAPNTLVQLYALTLWAGTDEAPEGADSLLRLSVLFSVASVGCGLSMWEHKVQERVSGMYIAAVSVMRTCEISSRALTLAVFACITHPYGLWWVLLVDYGVMLVFIAKHQSVHCKYGIFLAIPLVLISLEPLVWTREDVAVPKDFYFMVRIVEFVVMWIVIIQKQDTLDEIIAANPSWEACEALALLSTLGLYVTLLFVWRSARRNELERGVPNWNEDGARQGLQSDGAFSSESDYSSSNGSEEAPAMDDELPPE